MGTGPGWFGIPLPSSPMSGEGLGHEFLRHLERTKVTGWSEKTRDLMGMQDMNPKVFMKKKHGS